MTKPARIERLDSETVKRRTGGAYPIRPEWFQGFSEQQLAKSVGLTQFGVNYVTLEPGARSALRHWHEAKDEFVLVVMGDLVLIDDDGEHPLPTGSFAGFPAGEPNAHHLANLSDASAAYLAVGSRRPGAETIHYPDDPLEAIRK